jgi:antitoxin MazE
MKVELVRIGNSRGIRIPKVLIEQCGFGDTVELEVEQGRLVIRRDRVPRKDWIKCFVAAGSVMVEDELLLDAMPENAFDREEWSW